MTTTARNTPSGAEPTDGRTPALSAEELSDCVAEFLARRDFFLDTCREHGSPLYVLERDVLATRAGQFLSAFRGTLPDVRVYFAMKSNNHPLVSRTLVESGLGLDVSSGLELQAALDAGSEDIIFSGPGKVPDELALAAANADRVTVLLDSTAELGRLQAVAARMDARLRAGVRVTTASHGIWRKFGIPLPDLPDFLARARTDTHVDVRGVQSHLSWNMDPDRQVSFIRELGAVLERLPVELQRMVEFVDLGGGFWPAQGDWLQQAGTPEGHAPFGHSDAPDLPLVHYKVPATDIGTFASALARTLEEHIFPHTRCRIFLEPGRWICNDAMHLLMTVVDKKAEDLVITDAGTNAVGWERFETDFFPVINLSRPSTTERECLVAGSLCTPHDLWGYSYHGSGIEEGDVLLVPQQGAYAYSLRQNFIKPLPQVVCPSALLSCQVRG
ncbi:MAG: alanine racemase [Verrucomicrobia bacterium]|nr:alanine racemase [Verrucomicrobiota bacterium]